jgi:hypothetical protein
MIKTAAQILIPEEEADHRARHLRRKRGKSVPCKNAYRGCTQTTGGTRNGGRGWCSRCYDRWRKRGDSWFHTSRVQYCTKKNCFMRGVNGHP